MSSSVKTRVKIGDAVNGKHKTSTVSDDLYEYRQIQHSINANYTFRDAIWETMFYEHHDGVSVIDKAHKFDFALKHVGNSKLDIDATSAKKNTINDTKTYDTKTADVDGKLYDNFDNNLDDYDTFKNILQEKGTFVIMPLKEKLYKMFANRHAREILRSRKVAVIKTGEIRTVYYNFIEHYITTRLKEMYDNKNINLDEVANIFNSMRETFDKVNLRDILMDDKELNHDEYLACRLFSLLMENFNKIPNIVFEIIPQLQILDIVLEWLNQNPSLAEKIPQKYYCREFYLQAMTETLLTPKYVPKKFLDTTMVYIYSKRSDSNLGEIMILPEDLHSKELYLSFISQGKITESKQIPRAFATEYINLQLYRKNGLMTGLFDEFTGEAIRRTHNFITDLTINYDEVLKAVDVLSKVAGQVEIKIAPFHGSQDTIKFETKYNQDKTRRVVIDYTSDETLHLQDKYASRYEKERIACELLEKKEKEKVACSLAQRLRGKLRNAKKKRS